MNGTNNLNTNNVPASNEYVFRTNAFASNGDEFNPNSDEWDLANCSGKLNFEELREQCSDKFVFHLKKTMKVLYETGNPTTAISTFRRFILLVKSIQNTENDVIDEHQLSAYLMRNNNVKYLPHIRVIVRKAAAIKAPLLSSEAMTFADSIKLADTPKDGSAIRSWDPEKGSLRPAEDQAVADALNNAFEEGTVKLRQYMVVRLIRGTGMRPAQLAWMKLSDIRDTENGMHIRIPMAKQRGQAPRSKFMPWKPITEGLARIIRLFIQAEILPLVSHVSEHQNVPLLLLERNFKEEDYDNTIRGHLLADTAADIYRRALDKVTIISPITGEQLVLNPRRERHTFATQLAMNGATADEIAINMGQASNTSCEAYIDATIDHFQSLERHVGQHFVPIADRFLGKVVKSANDTAEFELYNDDFEGVGSCSSGGCNAVEAGVAPQACYVCRKFNAWSDGPHEELLKRTIQEQQKLLDEGHAEVAETKTNIIIAITDLIEAIRQKKDAA